MDGWMDGWMSYNMSITSHLSYKMLMYSCTRPLSCFFFCSVFLAPGPRCAWPCPVAACLTCCLLPSCVFQAGLM